MAVKVEASINVLWQNLIALNASLIKENEGRGLQLSQIKILLQEEIEKSKEMRKELEGYKKELSKKNKKINRLSSKLEMLRQLTSEFFKDDNSDDEATSSSFVKDLTTSTSSKHIGDQNAIVNPRKISDIFNSVSRCDTPSESSMQGLTSTPTTPLFGINFELSPLHNDNSTDSRTIDENLLTPLLSLTSNEVIQSTKNVCDECGQHLSSPRSLSRHKLLHTGLRPFTCPFCALTFTRSDSLKSHVNKLHAEDDRPKDNGTMYSCSMCSKVFKSKRVLVSHKEITHRQRQRESSKSGTPTCNICNATFSCSGNMQRHKRNIHNL